MFWRKGNKKKKKNVKEIRGPLWQYMINKQHVPLGVLHNLRLVERDVLIEDKPQGLTTIRIFYPGIAEEEGVTVDDYESLDNYPELVLYEGYYQVVDGQVVNIRIEKQPERVRSS
jgi:hypothetical protein